MISIGNHAFEECRKLENITIGKSVVSIGDRAFHCCRSLKSVTIGNSVTSIGEFAFASDEKLESVIFGNSLTSIGRFAFSGCTSLKSINVNSGNSYYSSSDGILYNKDKTKLIRCPQGKTGSVTIPGSVTDL